MLAKILGVLSYSQVYNLSFKHIIFVALPSTLSQCRGLSKTSTDPALIQWILKKYCITGIFIRSAHLNYWTM